MNNKILNRQISLEQIIKIADYLEDYKESYDRKFEIEENKNRNLPYGEKQWEYENGSTSIHYTIEFKNGENVKESNYNWFVGNLNQPHTIKSISIDLYVSFYTKNSSKSTNDVYNKIGVSLYFREFDASIDIDTTNQENESRNIYSNLMNIVEDNDVRYNNTIKHRKLRIQSFTISVGLILTYIIFLLLKIDVIKLPVEMSKYLSNKNFLIFGQWFVSILLGNIVSYWYIFSIYKPLLPSAKYAGYNSSTYKSVYKDDLEDYTDHSEIHFGKYWDAEKRRSKIEKIYKVTSKIILLQLLISVLLFFILK